MFSRIVVGTDGSETAARAVAEAIDVARLSHAELHIVTALRRPSRARVAADRQVLPEEFGYLAGEDTEAKRQLAAAASAARARGVSARAHAIVGETVDVLVDVAQGLAADLIVVGNKGMASRVRRALGTVPNAVAHRAPCTVLIAHTC